LSFLREIKENDMPKSGLVALGAVLVVLQLAPIPSIAQEVDFPSKLQPIPAENFLLQSYEGTVVLMDFWASWCKPCEKSMPWLSHMQTEYESEGLQVVAVNLDSDWDSAVELASTLPANVILVHDPEGILAAERNLQGMPSAYVYDRKGQLYTAHVGFHPDEKATRESEISALLKGLQNDSGFVALGDDRASVQPWQRDLLAAPGMEIDPDPIETALDEHIYFSKEASSGGLGSGGGGCGCN
jgi:cytochrome c biogenesis protein CcmG, thiol:disulfide interchange protein DsbE